MSTSEPTAAFARASEQAFLWSEMSRACINAARDSTGATRDFFIEWAERFNNYAEDQLSVAEEWASA